MVKEIISARYGLVRLELAVLEHAQISLLDPSVVFQEKVLLAGGRWWVGRGWEGSRKTRNKEKQELKQMEYKIYSV